MLTLLLALVLCLPSCQSDPLNDVSPGASTPELIDQTRAKVAKAMAIAMKEPAFSSRYIEEAMVELTGDREILYARFKGMEIDGEKVSQTLAKTERKILPSQKSVQFFESGATSNDPGLTIYMFVPEDIAPNSQLTVSKVAYLPEEYDESTTVEIPCFDSSGELSTISIKEEPAELVLVVKENERMLAVFESSGTTKYGNTPTNISGPPAMTIDGIAFYDQFMDQSPIPLNTLSSVSIGDTVNRCYEHCPEADRHQRDNREQLVKLKFVNATSFRNVCPWPDGKPEIQINWIAFSDAASPVPNTIKKIIRDSRKQFIQGGNTKWYYPPEPLLFLKFNLDSYADPVLWKWVELDNTEFSGSISLNSPNLTFNIGIFKIDWQPFSFTIDWDPQNDDIGEDAVYFCDPANNEGTQYNTGLLNFYAKEEQ